MNLPVVVLTARDQGLHSSIINSSTPMTTDTPSSYRTNPLRGLRRVRQTLSDGWRAAEISLRNESRLRRNARVDYVVMPVGGPLPERMGRPRGFL